MKEKIMNGHRHYSKKWMLLASVFLLAGCTLNTYIPSERLSDIAKLSDDQILDHPVQAYALLTPEQVDNFSKDSLNWSVGRALEESPVVRQAYYGLAGTSVGIAEARSLQGPQLSLDGQYGGTDSSGNEPLRSNHILGFDLNVTLFDGGVRALNTDKARWQAMGALANVGQQIEAVAQAVAESYIGVLKAQDHLRLAQKHVLDMQNLAAEVKKLAAVGATNASDVPEVEARVELFKQQAVSSIQVLADANAKLRRWTGQAPADGEMRRPADAPVINKTEEQLVLESVEHPAVKMLDYEIQSAIKAVCAVDAERNGNLVLQLGTVGLAQAFLGKSVIELGTALLHLTLPLIDSGNRDARLRHTASDLEVSIARRIDIERSIGYTVRQAVHARDAAIQQAKLSSAEYDKIAKVARIKRSDYKAGIVDLKSVLDAEQMEMDAEIKVSDSNWDRTLSTYTLLGAQGQLALYLKVISFRQVDIKGSSDPFPQPTLLKPGAGGLLKNVPLIP